ncbi:putative glycosyltransferase YibD [Lentibacillus sp. JNUCC-1]|uniref:glycosyltransferase family 2 protein n=1 Tax=Lentibacillus sp. JNUCC-1 TaxID=2654513 RepID=UPI00132B0C24|nr:putative glycosyltransferase YibD [Lentibacillus sp. JNUCC-1]
MSPKVSIIVPVYNLEALLPKCVDSILAQTFTDFELILVNDGSPDESGAMCEAYAKMDSRVKVIHKQNGGTASSRNVGLSVATGDYIGFVDNDDYVHVTMFETLYRQAVLYDSDIIVCDFLKVDEGDNAPAAEEQIISSVQHFNSREALNQFYTQNNVTFVVPWNKLYKRHLFDGVSYEVGNSYDDETVAHLLYFKSRKTTYIHVPLYYYVQRQGSMVNSRYHLKRFGAVYALKGRAVFFREKQEYELHEKALKVYMEKFFWHYFTAKKSLVNIDDELKQLKRTFNENILHLLKIKGVSWKQKGMWMLFVLNPSLFEWIKDRKRAS